MQNCVCTNWAPAAIFVCRPFGCQPGGGSIGLSAAPRKKSTQPEILRPEGNSPASRSRRAVSSSRYGSRSNTGLASGWSPADGSSPRSTKRLCTPVAAAPSRSLCKAMRLRSRQVSWRMGSMSASTSIAAAASAPRCGRAPAPSVTLTASARPLSGNALASNSSRSADTGGVTSAVITKCLARSLSCRVKAIATTWQNPVDLASPRMRQSAMFQPAKSLNDALAAVTDGCMVVVPREVSGVPMAATRALIRRGVKRLHLVALPTSSLQADLLIGAGCIETLETSAVSLGEFGPAPRFSAAITSGTIKMKDATCPALHAALQASEKGVPFMPLRGILGSDILAHRRDWRVIDNPFGADDPIVLLPALHPDVVLIHAPMADRAGNLWIGRQRELVTMAHAAQRTIVTVEEIRDANLLHDPLLAAGTLPGFYVDAVAVAPRGAWPLPLPDRYGIDAPHVSEYARLAATPQGFAQYLDRYVYEKRAA